MRFRLIGACVGAVLTPALLSAQAKLTAAQEIAAAVSAAPAELRDGATVLGLRGYKTEVLRKGTNDMVCWDQSVWPGQLPFSVHCTSSKSMDRVDQNREFYYQYKTREAAEKAIKEAETAGKRVLPEYGAGHYGLQGKDQETARPHVTIAVPNATAASLKIPDKPSTSGIWLMDAGTTGAHIMIPGH